MTLRVCRRSLFAVEPTSAHLVGFVEEKAEICEDNPELLPAAAVLELPQQVAREEILKVMGKTM